MENDLHVCRVCSVVFQNFAQEKATKAILLLEKVNDGQLIDAFDAEFLNQVFLEARVLMPIVAHNPEYQAVAARILGLYETITHKAFANEEAASS